MIHNVLVEVPQHSEAAGNGSVVPPSIPLDGPGFEVRLAVYLDDQEALDDEIDLSDSGQFHVLHEGDSSLLEVHGRQGFEQGIGFRAHEIQDAARPAVPVSGQLSAQEIRRYVAAHNGTLHHGQRLRCRTAPQDMHQHISEGCHGSARHGRQRRTPMQDHAIAG
jgi:hypothetical protein